LSKLSEKKEIEIAQENGWYRLGDSECSINLPISDVEKIDLGKQLSHALCQIERLREELSVFKSQIKERKEPYQEIVEQISPILETGKRADKAIFPLFLDSKNKVCHWVNVETGEIVNSRPSSANDVQMRLDK